MSFSPFDLFALIVALVAAALGFRSGILGQLGSLIGIIAGIVVCRLFGPDLEQWCAPMVKEQNPAIVTVLVYAILFFVSYFIIVAIANLIRRIIHSASLGIVDRLCGAVYKGALWIFILSLLLNIWSAIAPSHIPEGKLTDKILDFAPTVIGSESAQQLWQTVKNGSANDKTSQSE